MKYYKLGIKATNLKSRLSTMLTKPRSTKRNEVIKKYTEIISALEKEYAENKLTLESKKKKEIKKIVEEYKDNPEGLAKIMSEKFGFVIYKKGECNDKAIINFGSLCLVVVVACASTNQYQDYTPGIVISAVEYDKKPYSLGCKGEFKCEKKR